MVDSSAAFANFISNNPGRILALRPGATYLMDTRSLIFNKDSWDLYGQGAKIRSQGLVAGVPADSWLRLVECRSWRIRDVEVIGPATLADATAAIGLYAFAREDWRGMIIDGGFNGRMDRVKIHGFWGDCLYIGVRGDADPYSFPDQLLLSQCEFYIAGRNAVSMVGGSNVTIDRCRIGQAGLVAWDTEPNALADATFNVTFLNCSFFASNLANSGSASHDTHGNGMTVMFSAGSGPCTNYLMSGCTLDIGAIYIRREPVDGTRNNIVKIIGCSATILGDAIFERTDNITFSGNNALIAQVLL